MRIFGIISLILVLLITGLLLAPQFIDSSIYRERIISVIEQQTGYEVEVKGGLNIAFIPAPHVQVQDLSLKHPQEESPLFTAKSVSIYLEPAPLLSGEIALDSFRLDEPDIALRVLENGSPNWQPPAMAEAEETAEAAPPTLRIESLTIMNGRFSFESSVQADPVLLEDIDGRLSMESFSGPFTLNASFISQNIPVSLDLQANRFSADAQAVPLQLKAGLYDGAANLNFSGVVGFGERPDVQGETQLVVPDLKVLASKLAPDQTETVPAAPLRTAGIITADLETLSYTNLNITVGETAFAGSVNVKGFQNYPSQPLNFSVDLKEGEATKLKGSVTVSPQSIEIADAQLAYASSRAEGNAIWVFPKTAEQQGKLGLTVNTGQINLDELQTRFGLKQQQQKPFQPQDIKQLAQQAAVPFDLDVKAEIGTFVTDNVRINGINVKAQKTGESVNIDQLDVSDYAGASVNVEGTIGNLTALEEINLKLGFQAVDLGNTLERIGQEAFMASLPAQTGPVQIQSDVSGSFEQMAFSAEIKALNANTSVDGLATNVLAAPAFQNLAFTLKHPDFAALLSRFNPDSEFSAALAKPVNLQAGAVWDNNIYKFENIKGSFGPIDLTGTLNVNLSGSVPEAAGVFQTGALPLDAFMNGAGTGGAAQASGNVRWSREAIDLSWMHAVNLELGLTSETITYGSWVFNNPAFTAKLRDGTLIVPDFQSGLFGGTASGQMEVAASARADQPAVLNTSLSLDDVGMQSLVTAVTGAPIIQSQGVIDFKTALKTSGISMAAWIFGLNGEGSLFGNDITIRGINVADLARAVRDTGSLGRQAEALLKTGIRGGSSEFETLQGEFIVREGVVDFNPLLLSGPDADVLTTGQVSLPAWTMDMASQVQLKVPAGQEPPPPLEITYRGALDNPAQSFAENAIRGYVSQRISDKLQDVIGDKIGGEGGKALQGIVGGLLGVPPQQQPPQPQPDQPQQPVAEPNPDPQPVPEGEIEVAPLPPQGPDQPTEPPPPPANDNTPQDLKPEDALKGLLKGLLQ